jgi:hypothetical protein
MKTISLKTLRCRAGLCAAAAILAMSGSAFADPTGINYNVSTVNLPGTGGGSVLWNNSPSYQTVPGTGTGSQVGQGLDVDEQVTLLGGNMELLEWAVKTTNGFGIVPQQINNTQPAGIFFTGLPSGTLVENSGFVYFTIDGVPQPMSNPTGNPNIVFFQHPLQPAIQVLALGNDALPATAFGIDTNALAPGTPLSTIFLAVGLGAKVNDINDIHLGVVSHVPEPGTLVLCGLGMLGLIPLVRRRLK